MKPFMPLSLKYVPRSIEASAQPATPGRSQLTDEKLILMPTKSGKTKKQPRLSRNYPEIDCHWRTNPFSGHICPIVLT